METTTEQDLISSETLINETSSPEIKEIVPDIKMVNRYRKEKLELTQRNMRVYSSKKIKASRLAFSPFTMTDMEDSEKVNDKTLKSLANIFRSTNKIHTLNIDCSASSRITDKGLWYLCESIRVLVSLKRVSLNFQKCRKITDRGLFHLHQALKTLRSLKSIDIVFSDSRDTKIGDFGVSDLGQALQRLASLRRISLKFSRFRRITNKGVSSLSQSLSRLTGLKSLSLRYLGPQTDNFCSEIDSKGVQAVSQSLKRLTALKSLSLNFSECKMIDDTGMLRLAQDLQNFHSLRKISLNFQQCWQIKNGARDIMSQALQKLTSLREIRLTFFGCYQATSVEIVVLGRTLQSLSSSLKHVHLDFSKSYPAKEAVLHSVQQALKSITLLKSLALIFDKITDNGINQFAQSIGELVRLKGLHLQFPGCLEISDESFINLCQSLQKLVFLRNLHLDFDSCLKITDLGMAQLSEALKFSASSLQNIHLKLKECSKISHVGTSQLSQTFSQLTLLKSLRLQIIKCFRTDSGIYELGQALKSLPALESFQLECDSIGDKALGSLNEGLKALVYLQTITLAADLYPASKECAVGFAKVLKTLPYLSSVDLSFCRCVGPKGEFRKIVQKILQTLPGLRSLSVKTTDG